MKPFAHDIRWTLLIKGILLALLWVVCFKGAPRNTTQAPQWLFGIKPALQTTVPDRQNTPTGPSTHSKHLNKVTL